MTGPIEPAGVGVCLTEHGARLAVLGRDPWRLLGVAEVAWPADLWSTAAAPVVSEHWTPAGPAEVARTTAGRILRQARRRLGLARWQPVAVVVEPSTAGLAATAVLAAGAQVLARAGLVQAWVMPADGAAALVRATVVALDQRFTTVVAEPGVQLALGAALLLAEPPPPPIEESPDVHEVGWAVELVGTSHR